MSVKINIMTIIAFVAVVMAIISLGCYEGGIAQGAKRHSYLDFFEASVVIGGVIALILMIVTILDKPEQLVGRVFIFFGLTSLLLIIGIILVIVHSAQNERAKDALIASYVFGAFELVALLAGVTAPFAFGS